MRDVYHQDDPLWGERITDKVAGVVASTERDQTNERKADTEGVSMEASIHAALTQTGGPEKPEERQQLQSRRQLKSVPMPKPIPNPTRKPTHATAPRPALTPMLKTTSAPKGARSTAPLPTRRWETVPSRIQKKPASPAPPPTTGSSMADRCLILRRDESVPLPNKIDQEIA